MEHIFVEKNYSNVVRNICNIGQEKNDRTGVGTIGIHHAYFNIHNPVVNFPILKGKKVYPKMSLKEVIWMLSGNDNVKWLQERGVNYWNEWADENGSIGRSYGTQFRNFNGEDQLVEALEKLVNNPMSRRNIITLWNPNDLNKSKLPPCVFLYQFHCFEKFFEDTETYIVDMNVYQRSADMFLGVPYDFMFDGWFKIIMCGLSEIVTDKKYIPGDIHHTCADSHIYFNHFKQVEEYLNNVSENKQNIINQTASVEIPIIEHLKNTLTDKSPRNVIKSFIDAMIDDDFKSVRIIKNYSDVYGDIKAPIAV